MEVFKGLIGELFKTWNFLFPLNLSLAFTILPAVLLSKLFTEPNLFTKLIYLACYISTVLVGAFFGGIYIGTVFEFPTDLYWWLSLIVILILSYKLARFITGRRDTNTL